VVPAQLTLSPPVIPPLTAKLLPISHSLANEVLGGDLANVSTYSPANQQEAQTINAAVGRGTQWAEDHYWKVGSSKLTDAFWKATAGSDTTESTSASTWQATRQQQYLVRFIHKYAESLQGSGSGLHQKRLIVDAKGRLKSGPHHIVGL